MNIQFKTILCRPIVVSALFQVVCVGMVNAAEFVPGEILVKFKPQVTAQSAGATVSAMGGAVQANLNGDIAVVKLPAGQDVAASVTAYAADPNIEFAQPNYIYHATATPNDTNYGSLWGFKNSNQTISSVVQGAGGIYATNNPPGPGSVGNDMGMETAWNTITNCNGVVVAVLDSGVNYNHEDLAANMWTNATYPNHGYNYVTGEGAANDPMDLNGHGTHVAGIIGALGNNATGVTGACWSNVKIMAVRVLNSLGSGSTASIISGINFAVTNGAKVINMSLGGTVYDQLYYNAISGARSNDVVVVVAAGNDGRSNEATPTYPCSFSLDNIICVAALDQAYALASFSNWGATSVDVGAPGTNMLSTWAGSSGRITDTLNAAAAWTSTGGWGYTTWNGTLNGVAGTYNGLADPSYLASANHHIYKNFNLSGYEAATLSFLVAGNVNATDAFTGKYNSAGGDPITAGTFMYDVNSLANVNWYFSQGTFISVKASLRSCLTAACTLGFGLASSAASVGASGPLVGYLYIDTLDVTPTNQYNTENGTSMASPAVAGVAVMLRAYNPQFTYVDVVNAIKNSGRATASLSTTTSTGKAVDAAAALAYINKPTGLSAAVQ